MPLPLPASLLSSLCDRTTPEQARRRATGTPARLPMERVYGLNSVEPRGQFIRSAGNLRLARPVAHIRVESPFGRRGLRGRRRAPKPDPGDRTRGAVLITAWRPGSQPSANPYFAADGAAVADREA